VERDWREKEGERERERDDRMRWKIYTRKRFYHFCITKAKVCYFQTKNSFNEFFFSFTFLLFITKNRNKIHWSLTKKLFKHFNYHLKNVKWIQLKTRKLIQNVFRHIVNWNEKYFFTISCVTPTRGGFRDKSLEYIITR